MSATRRPRAGKRSPAYKAGAVFLVISAIVLALLAAKPELRTWLRAGETIEAEFASNYHGQLYADETPVKLPGIKVGVVSDVEPTDHGTVLLSLKVDDEVVAELGNAPWARVVPKTVLGGEYAIELKRSGLGAFTAGRIPLDRTSTPVELDRLLEALPAPTRKSLQDVVGNFGRTLDEGGGQALRELVDNAPDTLKPASKVLLAARGMNPDTDLPRLVTNLKATAEAMSGQQGELTEIVEQLHATTSALGDGSRPLANTIAVMPKTLRSTQAGMTDLGQSLDKVRRTAKTFRPSAKELEPLLRNLNPVLRDTVPLLDDLNPLLEDARPAMDELVPVARRGTAMLDDLRGPVLKRVNGPVLDFLMDTWRGKGPYKDSGGGAQREHKVYEELAYMLVNLDRASMMQDAQGSLLNFQAGIGTRSVAGTPFTLPNLLEQIHKYAGGTR